MPVSHRTLLLAGAADPEERQCRICFDTNDPESLIAPCMCSGTQRWIHRACLNEWRAQERVPRAFTHCPTCRFEYLTALHESEEASRSRSVRFRMFVVRDTLLVFAVVQSILALVGLLIHLCDRSGAVKSLYPRSWAARTAAEHLAIGPYYTSAVVVCLALLGLIGMWLQHTGRLPATPPRSAIVRRHEPLAPTCDVCCNGCVSSGSGDVCCQSCCAVCEGGGGGGGGCALEGCGACDASGCAAEGAGILLPLTLVALLLLAVVGVVYALFFATIVMQRLAQRHVHLLQMRSETQRVIVCDLANEGREGSLQRSSSKAPIAMPMEGIAMRV